MKPGVDDFIAEATPEKKLAYLRAEQGQGKLVAMMGDGTNDAPSLAQADVGLAMNSGTQAAKEAGNMVDLDSDPTKLIEVVAIGKQLLMTRGALTTFSIANDVAKYFAIVPAMFAGTLPWLKAIDVMHLHSPTSAILSAVIFNALIIPLLIPIALKGVQYRPLGGGRAAAPQPADLGPRRRDRSLHRNQGDRRRDGRLAFRRLSEERLHVALSHEERAAHRHKRRRRLRRLSRHSLGDRANAVPVSGERQHRAQRRRKGHRLAAGGAALHQGRVLPAAAVGGLVRRDRVDVFGLRALELCAARPRRARDRADRDYASGDKKGQLVAPDVEAWFKADKAGGNPHIVAQWADAHNSLAQAWVTADPTHGAYVDAWAKAHDDAVKEWIKKNPATPQPKASDLAVLFFENFSNEHPGMFPSSVTKTGADGKPVTDIEPVSAGSDIQSIFFDTWRAGPSRRRAERRAGRSCDRFRLRARSRHHLG